MNTSLGLGRHVLRLIISRGFFSQFAERVPGSLLWKLRAYRPTAEALIDRQEPLASGPHCREIPLPGGQVASLIEESVCSAW